ncbi:MAG: AbrB/MazE/SpoVT family DNA-binding domain-containing protein [bacterium]
MNLRPLPVPPKPALIKRLTKHGNSQAIVIDKAILELLGITEDTPLLLSTDGERLILTPQRADQRRQRIAEALERINAEDGEVLRKLAE